MADNDELIKALLGGNAMRDLRGGRNNAMAPPPLGWANAMPAPSNPLSDALLGLRDRIPENTEHSLSLANMLRSGLGSAAGWMDWRSRLSPDDYKPQEILAPLGASALGSAPVNSLGANTFRRSPDLPEVWRQAHPSTSTSSRLSGERPTRAASSYGNDVFVSPHVHGGEYEDAVAALGQKKISELERADKIEPGFTTNAGRFLDRNEAQALADVALGGETGRPRWPGHGLETYDLRNRIFDAWKKAKERGDQGAMDNLSQQYREAESRLEAWEASR